MFTVTERHVQWYRQVRSLVFLSVMTVAMFLSEPRPGLHGRGLALLAGVLVAGTAWALMAFRAGGERMQQYSIGLCVLGGLWLVAWRAADIAPCYLLAAASVAVASLSVRVASVVIGAAAAVQAATLAVVGASVESILIWSGAMLLILLVGVVRRQRETTGEQARLLVEEQARAATLAERARLAREIHDVLAHSLSALSVQLETAAALLERDRAADAAAVVDKAGRLARDGLTETRRAVSALRGDPLPLPELIRELSGEHGFAVDGTPRDVAPESGLAVYRAAQEALTNVRKHAPGSQVDVRLVYATGSLRLTVRNHGPAGPPTTGLSSGYGLTGLRERAELAGGTVTAGPAGDGWLVDVRMPG